MPQAALSDTIAEVVFYLVVTAWWLSFVVTYFVGRRAGEKGDAKRDVISTLGMLLQMSSYVIVFALSRKYFSPFLPMSKLAEIVLGVFAVLLAAGSAWLCFAAARALGKQWALMARVIEGHELITSGPYAAVRNPIYLAILMTLIACGLAASTWQGLLVAIVVCLAGTWIRIRSEEKLLREAFGAKFEDYARRVPALLPRLLR